MNIYHQYPTGANDAVKSIERLELADHPLVFRPDLKAEDHVLVPEASQIGAFRFAILKQEAHESVFVQTVASEFVDLAR